MIEIRNATGDDRVWLTDLFVENWSSTKVVTRGVLHELLELPSYVAVSNGEPAGALVFRSQGASIEVVSLTAIAQNRGVGSALVRELEGWVRTNGSSKIRLVTTNDNTSALRFWRKRGYSVCAIHRNVVARSRELKPEIPAFGQSGLPIRDEVELAKEL